MGNVSLAIEGLVPRKKRKNIRRIQPLELDMDDPAQAALWEHYQMLTQSGKAADWLRSALIAALPLAGASDAQSHVPDARPTTPAEVRRERRDAATKRAEPNNGRTPT